MSGQHDQVDSEVLGDGNTEEVMSNLSSDMDTPVVDNEWRVSGIDLDLTQFLRKQIDLRTSYASSKDDYLRAFDLLLSQKVDSGVLTEEYLLKDAEQGFIDSEQLKVTKVLLDCSLGK